MRSYLSSHEAYVNAALLDREESDLRHRNRWARTGYRLGVRGIVALFALNSGSRVQLAPNAGPTGHQMCAELSWCKQAGQSSLVKA
jgi:hypothetical protein